MNIECLHRMSISNINPKHVEECYGVWYHGLTVNSNEPSRLLAVFDTKDKAQQYINNIKNDCSGYCFIVASNFYR